MFLPDVRFLTFDSHYCHHLRKRAIQKPRPWTEQFLVTAMAAARCLPAALTAFPAHQERDPSAGVGGPRDNLDAPAQTPAPPAGWPTHDTNVTAGQTDDVVPDGPDQMDERVAGQQSLQSWSLEPAEERAIPDILPTNALAVPGEVFQMLGLRMHDVGVG